MTKLITLAALCFLAAPLAQAEGNLDGYVSPQIQVAHNQAGLELGNRLTYLVEFGRISRNVALDLRYGSGLGYSDYGSMFKVFYHWKLLDDDTLTGIIAGAGLGATYSSSGSSADTATPANQRAFWELQVQPFVRGLYDTGYGIGLNLDLGYQVVPFRRKTTGSPTDLGVEVQQRFMIAIGVSVGV